MKLIKKTYTNPNGEKISAIVDLPSDQKAHNFAVFAHCFTCSKNLSAVKNISRALTSNGFGVLRFDFTGLGQSEGDFSDTNFSGNVEDLIEVSIQFGEEYQMPTLMIGHSLGGAATIVAASKLESVKAVATIGAPADPHHVTQLLKGEIEEIKEKGEAIVTLAGRDFKIKKQFLDDLEDKQINKIVDSWRKALLIMHSPIDETVGIENARTIYEAAKHPKSYITLDKADHLLNNKEDSIYAGNTIANWALRYIDLPKQKEPKTNMQVVASIGEDKYTTQISAGKHSIIADEPEHHGGNDYGPNPYDLLVSSLAACKAMTVKMYAKRKGWELENAEIHITHSKDHAVDCNSCENSKTAMIDKFEVRVELKGNLSEDQKERLLEITKKCPVHKTLMNEILIETELIS